MRTQARRLLTTTLALALLALPGAAPSWASPRDRPPSAPPSATAPAAERTAADLPKPPVAMTRDDRREQLRRERHEQSPLRAYIDPSAGKPSAPPHAPPTEPAQQGPAAASAGRAAAPPGARATGNPLWVNAYASAYPAKLSIGGQLKLPTATASPYSGMWLYVVDEAGTFVHQQEIKRSTGDPTGRYLDNGAWCYGWWAGNSYPADQP